MGTTPAASSPGEGPGRVSVLPNLLPNALYPPDTRRYERSRASPVHRT